MKKLIILFVAFLISVGFTACGNKESVVPPTPDNDPKPVAVVANDYVVYEANEKIFAHSDAFKAIDARLDELQALGVNVLWLMPIQPSGKEKSVNSPYCIRDFKGVNPAYGTLSDLKTLVAHAHERKMKVILDWIANHSSWDNAWVKDHPDWYTAAQTGDETAWNDVTFLNYAKPEVHTAMIDAMLYWMNEADIDGYRCDYAQGVPDNFWTAAIQAIRAVKPDAIMLAETSRLELYKAGFDWMYSWSYLNSIQGLLGNGSLNALYKASNDEWNTTPEGKQRLRYITNHDACSEHSNGSLYKSVDGMLAASCLTYFLGGVPLIYSSQEIGYLQSINFCVADGKSVLMDWNSDKAKDALNKYKALMKAYHATAQLRGGKQEINQNSPDVANITYTSTEGTLLILVNIRGEEVTYNLPMSLQNSAANNLMNGQQENLRRELVLGGYEYKIYKL